MSTIAAYCTSDLSLGAPNPRVAMMFALEKGLDLTAVMRVVDLPGLANRSAEEIAKNPTGALPYVELADGTVVGESIAICELIDEQPVGKAAGVDYLFGANASERAVTRCAAEHGACRRAVPWSSASVRGHGSRRKVEWQPSRWAVLLARQGCARRLTRRAVVDRMWQRRVEHLICLPIISGLRWGPAKDFFAKRTPHNIMASDDAAEGQTISSPPLPPPSFLDPPHSPSLLSPPGQFETARQSVAWLEKTMAAAGSPDWICGSRYTVADVQLFVFVDWALGAEVTFTAFSLSFHRLPLPFTTVLLPAAPVTFEIP